MHDGFCQSPTGLSIFFQMETELFIKSSLLVSMNTTLNTINGQINPQVLDSLSNYFDHTQEKR